MGPPLTQNYQKEKSGFIFSTFTDTARALRTGYYGQSGENKPIYINGDETAYLAKQYDPCYNLSIFCTQWVSRIITVLLDFQFAQTVCVVCGLFKLRI